MDSYLLLKNISKTYKLLKIGNEFIFQSFLYSLYIVLMKYHFSLMDLFLKFRVKNKFVS